MVFINTDEEDFAIKDHGGAIYTLPPDTFETDAKVGMGDVEWVSKVSVKPLSKEIFATSADALKAYGVERYFVSNETFRQIQANPANGLNLVT